MTSYATLDAQLTGRCSRSRKVANNTYAIRRDHDIALRLHDTDVVTFHPDGSITLNTGGWYTMTTKERMNGALPKAPWDSGTGGWVYSVKGEWHVKWQGHDYVFKDGIRLFPDGTVTGAPDQRSLDEDRKIVAYRKKLIKDYIAALKPADIAYNIEHAEGDPWCCSMRAEDGDRPMGHDCILEHVRRRHTHGTLILRAVEARGYHNPNVIMSMIHGDATRGRIDGMLTDTLRKFFTKELITGRATR